MRFLIGPGKQLIKRRRKMKRENMIEVYRLMSASSLGSELPKDLDGGVQHCMSSSSISVSFLTIRIPSLG